MFDFVGQAKWSAWNELGDISKVSLIEAFEILPDILVSTSNHMFEILKSPE